MECSLTNLTATARIALRIHFLVLAVLLFIAVAPAHSSSCSIHAGGTDCDGYNDAGSSPQYRSAPKHVGNSVDIVTGNNYQGALDFKTADSFLSFKRHYNSVNAGYNVGLGAGWRSTYDVSINYQDAKNLSVTQSDGRIIRFTAKLPVLKNGVAGQSARFEPVNTEDGVITRQGAHHSWQLPDKRTLNFKGRVLTHIDFGSGHSLKLFYVNQRLSTVTDETGRQLRYQYTQGQGLGTYQQGHEYTNHPGHLEKIILPDESDIRFFYDQQRNLRKVVQADESTMEYDYQDGIYPGYIISKFKNSILHNTWKYDTNGTVASYTDIKNALEMKLSYHQDSTHPEAGHTRVTGKKGNTFRYQWLKSGQAENAVSNFKITSTTGKRCIGCPAINPDSHNQNKEAKHDSIVYPSSIVPVLNALKATVVSTNLLGYPETVQLKDNINGYRSFINLDFSAKGNLNSIKATREDNSTVTLTINPGSKATDPTDSRRNNTNTKSGHPDSDSELAELTDRLVEIAAPLNNAGDFRTQSFKGVTDDYSASVEMDPLPIGLINGLPTPGNPPLCTDDATCESLNQADFFYDFAFCAYLANRPCNNGIPEGWDYVDPEEAGFHGSADISLLTQFEAYAAAVFYNEDENRVIISYSGSDEPADFLAAAELFSGSPDPQGDRAIALADTIAEIYPDAEIQTTGHSLGGALATLTASNLGINGVVFGSSGIDEQTANEYELDWETTDLINHFYVAGDTVGDPPAWHFSIANSQDGLTYENNAFQPVRALTYELEQPPGEDWGGIDAHLMANIGTTLEHHRNVLECGP